MAEITSTGYQTLLDYLNSSKTVPAEWDYIEVYDDVGDPVTRVSVTGDARCSWTDVDSDTTLTVNFEITGSDADITLPVTIEKAALWTASSGGKQVTQKESFATDTLDQSGDKLVLNLSVDVPL